ncbi:MAG: putative alpha/beta-hydrolase family hydrolase [Polaribacter sp.]|jgi:predicted alpha/beta-hydrolase family hydrolase
MKFELKKSIENRIGSYLFLFTHGAGAGIEHEFMKEMVRKLNLSGLQTIPFNFPYMKIMQETGKRRPPDRMPKLIEAFAKQLEHCQKEYPNQKIIIGGKSMGGRVASLLAAQLEENKTNLVDACICLGFPFHPPKKLDKYRGEHLAKIKTPTLILQGERDTFGSSSEIDDYILSAAVNVSFIPDGDHSFKPRVRSGHTLGSNIELSVKAIIEYVASLSK